MKQYMFLFESCSLPPPHCLFPFLLSSPPLPHHPPLPSLACSLVTLWPCESRGTAGSSITPATLGSELAHLGQAGEELGGAGGPPTRDRMASGVTLSQKQKGEVQLLLMKQ